MHDACASREILFSDVRPPLDGLLWMMLRIVSLLGVGLMGGFVAAVLYNEFKADSISNEPHDTGKIHIMDDDESW